MRVGKNTTLAPQMTLYIPAKYLSRPWETPSEILLSSNIELGVTYPFPIVDFDKSRQFTVQSFEKLRSKR